MHTYIYLVVVSSYIQTFWVSLTASVINFLLAHSFYIDANKNIISCLNTVKMLFVIRLLISSKKLKHLSFLIHFGKLTEDKWWLGVGLRRCDR